MTTSLWKSAFKIAAATVVYAGVHSLLASHKAKRIAERALGRRRRAAFYRPFYITQSLLTLAGLYVYSRTLPDKTLYTIRGLPARLLNAGQLSGILWAIWAANAVGTKAILGVTGLQDLERGQLYINPEPEAQGPALEEGDRMKARGPFRFCRHPLNLAPLPIFWLMPKMTVQLLAFNLTMTAYMVIGSIHEEHRLLKVYGEAYQSYSRSGVPFYLPHL